MSEAKKGGVVMSVSASPVHGFSKAVLEEITLIEGQGVAGDAHLGVTVKHRSRVAVDPTQPNLRQVHLVQAELFDELSEKGFTVAPGDIGENIATRHLDLLSLPRGTILQIGEAAQVELTGLRNPCRQLHDFQPGLTEAVLDRDANGELIRKAGVMAVVHTGGPVRSGDAIQVVLPQEPHAKLEKV
ncbi:MOSC domain-containing protein [Allorhizobium sp. BGMRC 0089]|uniref:MOSC domain-containing protein n=1 Tax=Allorhizobium sonneratiae TaxID=2934936 RepID=UPI00203458D0|nr:MOSC domain-containing protein [Allorhizobium sonneratiae]MCM2293005.1 MOSC domain-containing protein [Allorhizobium sonneratiae]